MDKLLARKKNSYMYMPILFLIMGLNDPKHEPYQDLGDVEIVRLETIVQKRLNSIKNIIVNKRISREKDIEYTVGFSYHPLINYLYKRI